MASEDRSPSPDTIESDYIAPHVHNPTTVSGVFGKGKVMGRNWMGALAVDMKLSDLMMVGSHDSGAVKGDHQYQNSSIKNQLSGGVRLLDFHLADHEGDIWLYHGEPCCKLGDVLIETETFLKENPGEKVIIVMRDSKTAPNPVDWSRVKALLELGFVSKLIGKDKQDAKLREMKENVILIAPKGLELADNWGEDALIQHPCPDTTDTLVGLHDHLQELTFTAIDKKHDKPVWIECRSREPAPKRKTSELQEVQKPSFLYGTERLHFNVISFSFVDKSHFSLIKDYFMKWQK